MLVNCGPSMTLYISHLYVLAKERAARVRACNSVKFETGRNLPQILKIVTLNMCSCM